MIKINKNISFVAILFGLIVLLPSCQRDLEGLELAKNPAISEVYIDGFSPGLEYAAFGGSDVTAFDIDTDVKYRGNSSMKISVPDVNDPRGSYAGGVYFTGAPRDLSGFTTLSFWARSSQNGTIDVVGIGNDLGENKFIASLNNVAVNSNWKKYYIPIPDPSKLTSERGMFYYAEGPEDGKGYTIWFDDVQFENNGTIAQPIGRIYEGNDQVILAETGDDITVVSSVSFNLPDATNLDVAAAPAYFTYESSDPSVATVNDNGVVRVLEAGTSVITAFIGGEPAQGSLTVTSTGQAVRPQMPAPVPDESASDVISIYSNQYDDITVDFYNGFWEFSTTQSEDVQVDGNDMIKYSMLNFVGIQFTTPTIDISSMTHIHLDIWTPNNTNPPNTFKVLLVDLGADGTFDGGDNTSHELTITSPTLQSESWVSLDIPLSDFAGLTTKRNLAQIVLSGEVPTVYMDNLYFYRGGTTGGPTSPETAAPTPSQSTGDVLSVFSDSYTNVDANLNPDWGQANVVSTEVIQGNNTLKYSGLDYQGIELAASQDVSNMEFLHINYWTANSSLLNVYLISPGPLETAFSMTVPTDGWGSVDIPLSAFAGVDLADVIQFKFDGNGTIFLDNIFFYRGGTTGGGDDPTTAAPAPSLPAANVISLFSDSYDDVPVDTWRTDWSAADFEDVTIADEGAKKYSNLDFVGIETVANQIDASVMTHFHLDVWSKNFTLFAIKLVDFGADGAFGGGDDVEHQVDFPEPMQGGWISYDIPLTDFAGLTTLSNISQYILVGQPTSATTVYIDNMYFHN